MDLPGAELLLRVWEEQYAAHPIRRALALLDAGWPNAGAGAWSRAPVGERDAALLLLYERLFGAQLQTVTHCPRCSERLESSFSPAAVGARVPSLPPAPAWFTLHERDYEIEFRLPDSEDLLTVARAAADALPQLLQRCIGRVSREGERLDAEKLPPAVMRRLQEEMAQRDPAADIRISLSCPACAHEWELGFDIVAHLWDELEDWAQRAVAEVHVLAGAYGWSERDILALSPTRRRCYLDMVQA